MIPGAHVYFQHFLELTTTRAIGMGEGPIPWDKIYQYAIAWDFDWDDFCDLLHVIRAMDDVYLKFRAKEMDKKTKSSDSKGLGNNADKGKQTMPVGQHKGLKNRR